METSNKENRHFSPIQIQTGKPVDEDRDRQWKEESTGGMGGEEKKMKNKTDIKGLF